VNDNFIKARDEKTRELSREGCKFCGFGHTETARKSADWTYEWCKKQPQLLFNSQDYIESQLKTIIKQQAIIKRLRELADHAVNPMYMKLEIYAQAIHALAEVEKMENE